MVKNEKQPDSFLMIFLFLVKRKGKQGKQRRKEEEKEEEIGEKKQKE